RAASASVGACGRSGAAFRLRARAAARPDPRFVVVFAPSPGLRPMTRDQPLVSVVMAVYNGEDFLNEAIASVLEQPLTDLELVIVDDGSTDSTPRILHGHASSDARVVVRRQENQALAGSLNHGLALVRAPLVARLDADDVNMPDRLER